MKNKLIGTYKIRDLKENEVYICEEGCGECNKVAIECETMTLSDPTDTHILEREYELVDSSDCCGSKLSIWDNLKDDEVSVEYDSEELTA